MVTTPKMIFPTPKIHMVAASDGFSVAMCTYNGSRYLEEQLESIAAQTYLPNEIVICDDLSTDTTTDIVKSFASRSPFPVRLFVNEQNLGSTRNFGKSVGLCRGRLIALSDQDDVWLPRKLERLAAKFDAQPNVGLVFSDAEVVDENLRPLGARLWDQIGFVRQARRRVLRGRALEVLLPGWTVTGATMAFRSTLRDVFLPIPTHLPVIHDGWIALMVAAVAEVSLIDAPLVLYRQHQEQEIGARLKHDVGPQDGFSKLQGIKEARNRLNSYGDLIRIIDEVRQRLNLRDDHSPRETFYHLDQRRQHLWARMQLSSNAAARIPVVLRELFSFRYWRFSNGISSAAKDFFVGRG